jgi:hypothetical protein
MRTVCSTGGGERNRAPADLAISNFIITLLQSQQMQFAKKVRFARAKYGVVSDSPVAP